MKRFVICGIAVLSLAIPVRAQESVTTQTLPGGATLVVIRDPSAKQAVVEAFFRVGVADENAVGEGGLSALLARTWAAGGDVRTANQIAYDIGGFGAFTTFSTGEYIELTAISDPGGIKEATQTLLMNIVASPNFPAEAIASAKSTVTRDRALRNDSLLADANFRLRNRVFAVAPEGRDPLGATESISIATPQSLRRYFDKTVGGDGNRAVFVVAGNVEPDEALDMVRASLAAGGWNGLNASDKKQRRIAPPVITEKLPANMKTIDLRRGSPACYVITGFVAPGTAGNADAWAAVTVLDAVLAGGKDSRLFPLRDKPVGEAGPVGYDIGGQLQPGRNNSLWTITVAGATNIEAARDLVKSTTQALSDGTRPVTAEELVRAKSYLKGKHRKERQRLAERTAAVGLAELRGLGSRFETDYESLIDAVTLEQVNARAKQIFSGNSLTVVTGTPPAL